MTEIKIRDARIDDCPSLARIIISATDHAFRGRVPDQCLDWLTPEESASNWAKNFTDERHLASGDSLYVAETESNEVIGLAMLTKISSGDGYEPSITKQYFHELRSLQVDPNWHGRGVGRQLVGHIANKLQREGATHLLVKVLVENPNQGFYEHLGAIPLGSHPYDWEGYMTEELIYGWNDIKNLPNAH